MLIHSWTLHSCWSILYGAHNVHSFDVSFRFSFSFSSLIGSYTFSIATKTNLIFSISVAHWLLEFLNKKKAAKKNYAQPTNKLMTRKTMAVLVSRDVAFFETSDCFNIFGHKTRKTKYKTTKHTDEHVTNSDDFFIEQILYAHTWFFFSSFDGSIKILFFVLSV